MKSFIFLFLTLWTVNLLASEQVAVVLPKAGRYLVTLSAFTCRSKATPYLIIPYAESHVQNVRQIESRLDFIQLSEVSDGLIGGCDPTAKVKATGFMETNEPAKFILNVSEDYRKYIFQGNLKLEVEEIQKENLTIKKGLNTEDNTGLVVEGSYHYGTDRINQINLYGDLILNFGEEGNYTLVIRDLASDLFGVYSDEDQPEVGEDSVSAALINEDGKIIALECWSDNQ